LKNKSNLRKEYKILLSEIELIQFMKNYKKELKEIHEIRTITSLYFDSISFELYKKSIFQDVDNFKLRVRQYSNEKSFYKEVKSNLFSGKEKYSKKLEIGSFNDVEILNYENKTFYPSAFTNYTRNYYMFHNSRITIDRNINYETHRVRTLSSNRVYDSRIVLEIKSLGENNDVEKYLFSTPTAFSKYKNAIKLLYKL